jgi:hypothetical protein
MTSPAAVSWAAHLGWLHLKNTPLAFLGFAATPYILSVLAIGELINDKLPKTPSRFLVPEIQAVGGRPNQQSDPLLPPGTRDASDQQWLGAFSRLPF